MNTRNLVAMLAIGMLAVAGSAAAVGTNVAGYGYVGVDAHAVAKADHEAVLEDADTYRTQVESDVKQRVDAVLGLVEENKAKAHAKAEMTVDAGQSAKGGLLAGLQANVAAFADWIQGIWVKPKAEASGSALSNAEGIAHGDYALAESGLGGTLDLGAATDLQATAMADYNLPEPPKPTLDFLGSIKAAFSAILQIG